MTVAVIVQARMGSTRLPGKVLQTLVGETVLRHVLRRCAAIPGVDAVCCAIPETPDSDPVAEEAARCGAVVVRGSELDVLDRYDQAARQLGCDVVMRVTSDCPLIDPQVAGAVLRLLLDHDAGYASNNLPASWPHGLDCEAFRREWLEQAAREARDPFEREHVTPWLKTSPLVRRVNLDGPGGEAQQQRWTLDFPEDLAFFQALFPLLPSPPALPGWREVWGVLQHHPEIVALNARRHDSARPGGPDHPVGH
ncbi:MAG: glycosyltransferase family protein [Magnetococcales bacterium]|nr:glycosyltransferase family protein [Magnetococcales bacterium]